MKRYLSTLVVTGLCSFLVQPTFAGDPPAAAIATKMAGVTDELNRKETGKTVQTEQKAIVSDLDELIAKLEKQCENCKGGLKNNRPRRGMDDSRISRGTGGVGTLVNPAESAKDWAKLSDRQRDRILQSMSEGFPPEYRTVLERYYRRLAEEKSAPAAGTTPDSKATDAPKAAGK
jgi:hypothetical protein